MTGSKNEIFRESVVLGMSADLILLGSEHTRQNLAFKQSTRPPRSVRIKEASLTMLILSNLACQIKRQYLSQPGNSAYFKAVFAWILARILKH